MIRRFALALVFALSAAGLALAADATGRWQGAIDTPDGPISLSYTFAVSGEHVTGTASGPEGEIAIENGKISGDILTFTVTLKDGALVLHEATVADDTMSVTVRGPWGEAYFSLKRVPQE